MKTNEFPAGWDEQLVREVIDYYENQTDEEAAAEHEAALESPTRDLGDPLSLPNIAGRVDARRIDP